ncbi:MAG: nucleotidyltransferase [Erysipelotrichaceae bacterium]|jgi:NDP-sugar pyrophosphorylase family protein|nr:nucleotidyltransferase [Erysipelotrichaceae bacterium]
MNKQPVLVILAGGMGSRYGGLKQIDTVGDNGESIIDFSIYDAIQAGFKRLFLIIRKEHQQAFEDSLVKKIRDFIEVTYCFQEMDDLPSGFSVPEGREKPWGTTHALLAIRKQIDAPFAIINADDFYGRSAYKTIYDYLTSEIEDDRFCMVGYRLKNTLSDSGSVTRGLCQVTDGYLSGILELQKIISKDGGASYQDGNGDWISLPPDSLASMNYWGFTPKIIDYFQVIFKSFLERELVGNPLKCEHVIPTAVGEMIATTKAKVKVLSSKDRWFGVTYREDKPMVQERIREYKTQGLYPHDLWKK